MKKLIFLFLIINLTSFSQSISIGVFTKGYPILNKVKTAYENKYGIGNVTLVDYANNYGTSLATLMQHDVIILNVFFDKTVPKSLADDFVTLYKNNKHIVLTTEGSELISGEKISAYVWNKITGQSITETKGGDYGTPSPPRFHPSNGPGGLSENNELTGSSTSYASFGNLNYLNVLHQRTKSEPECSNIEALDALYPHKPSVGKGTIYINGEIYYPFYRMNQEVLDLAKNIVLLHHAILTNDNSKLTKINAWSTDPNLQKNFIIKKEDISLEVPNVFSPNNDNINDIFKLNFPKFTPKTIDFKVFNRWGSIVYSSQDVNFKWNGTASSTGGSTLSEGVYFYTLKAVFESECKVIQPDDTELTYKGSISLFR